MHSAGMRRGELRNPFEPDFPVRFLADCVMEMGAVETADEDRCVLHFQAADDILLDQFGPQSP